MAKASLAVLAVALTTALAGCSWNHPTKGHSELRQDMYQCQQEARAAAPIAMQNQSAGSNTRCTRVAGYENCTTTQNISEPVDINERARSDVRDDCLRAKGYFLQSRF